MTPEGLCLKCGTSNSRAQYACAICGARLPWADAAKLRDREVALKPAENPTVSMARLPRKNRLLILLAAVVGISGTIFVLQPGLVRSLRWLLWPNRKPRPVQEDEIRIAVFKKILPGPNSRHRSRTFYLSLGGKDPDEFVMQQLAGYYPFIKKVSEAAINYNSTSPDSVTSKETGQEGTILFVRLATFDQDKAQVSAGYWEGMMMSCWSAYDIEWSGAQWIVGEAQPVACS